MADKKLPLEVTPLATAGFSKYLYEKDTKFASDPAKAKFNIKLLLPKQGMGEARVMNGKEVITGDEWIAHINELHQQGGGSGDGPIKDGDVIRKKDGSEIDGYAGHWVITCKSSFQPEVIDTKKNAVPEGVKVFGGDKIKVLISPAFYEGFGGGVTLRMNKVMLIEKNNGGSAEAFGDDEEGYVAEASQTDAFGGGEGEPVMAGADLNGDY